MCGIRPFCLAFLALDLLSTVPLLNKSAVAAVFLRTCTHIILVDKVMFDYQFFERVNLKWLRLIPHRFIMLRNRQISLLIKLFVRLFANLTSVGCTDFNLCFRVLPFKSSVKNIDFFFCCCITDIFYIIKNSLISNNKNKKTEEAHNT